MPWLRLDDKLAGHPKLTRYEDDVELCLGTLTHMWLFCADNLTDGVIPRRQVDRYDQRIVGLLLLPYEDGPGFLETDSEGRYRCHDYLDYNPSREEVLKQREESRLRVKKHREKAVCNAVTNGVTNGVCNTYPVPVPKVFPSRADGKTKTLSSKDEIEVPGDVLGYWLGKSGRSAKPADLRSLRMIVEAAGSAATKLAIGQACVQGAEPDNYALITTIARAEAS